MQTADSVRRDGKRMVLLHKSGWETSGCEFATPEHFRKEAARVADPRWHDQFHGGNGGGANINRSGLRPYLANPAAAMRE